MTANPLGTTADRFRKVSAAFTDRVEGVPAGAWDNAAPCEGWVARDVVTHLTEWMPALFLGAPGLPMPQVPPVADDPAAAWAVVRDAIQAVLDDPEASARTFDTPPGPQTVESACANFGVGDVLIHTWDLARATGQDETIDAAEVAAMVEGFASIDDEMMRNSGHFGPRVEVPDDADPQTKLIAFTGRQP